jgi:hypothetical protein
MSTSSYGAAPTPIRTGVQAMPNTQTQLTPELAEVVRKIHALRTVTKTTGFFTTKTIIDILGKLSEDDLIAVGEALKLKPRELNFNR